MMYVLDWWEWMITLILFEYMKIDWSEILDCWWNIECVVIDCVWMFVWEHIEMIVVVLLFINSNHPQYISFYIESLWFEYELCVIWDNLLFNISCFHHYSIWYAIHTLHSLYQYHLFTSTNSSAFSLRDELWW